MPAILLDRFYKIDTLQKEGDTISARVNFDGGHPIFLGHFPDMPIVPGVCQTQMLGEILSKAIGINIQLIGAASIKFLSVIDPNTHPSINLQITFTHSGGMYNVSSQYFWEQSVFFKFKGKYVAS